MTPAAAATRSIWTLLHCARVSHPRSSLTTAGLTRSLIPAFDKRRLHVSGPLQAAHIRKDHDVSASESRSTITNRKATRSPAAKNSLRSVAVEAERSRGGAGGLARAGTKRARVEDAKTITAYCAAEQYSMPSVSRILKDLGYTIDPFDTGLYPQVLHVLHPPPYNPLLSPKANNASTSPPSQHPQPQPQTPKGDIFIFPSGTVVTWNIAEDLGHHLVSTTLLSASENAHVAQLETEDLEYIEDPSSEKSSVHGDTVRLGTRAPAEDPHHHHHHPNQTHPSPDATSNPLTNLTLTKIAFSSGLARSTKLSVLESSLSSYFRSTHSIPLRLSQTTFALPFSRRFILRKLGELLTLRAQLNLYSELTDSLPDLFWDSRAELSLESYFDQVGRSLDVGVRIKVLNERMDYAAEIAGVLREVVAERHGLLVEWAIVGLICVEVGFEVLRRWEERRERREREGVGGIEWALRKWLERELKEE